MKFIGTTIPVRTEIAKWYGLSERGLRYRLAQKGVHITNRILTLSDIELIISQLGKPPLFPADLFLI